MGCCRGGSGREAHTHTLVMHLEHPTMPLYTAGPSECNIIVDKVSSEQAGFGGCPAACRVWVPARLPAAPPCRRSHIAFSWLLHD